ncbi:type III secretion system outer membrane ring subunit SctC [Paraburkholderia humisilvae]|nr:type III secretion system outer membrane ring subunit SctC [Paraburkholderia humisilvae]
MLVLLGHSLAGYAAPVHWRSSVVHVAVDGKNLKDVLRDFTASQGVVASVADNVQGSVTGNFDVSPQRFLDTLASSFGFVWFYDGRVLWISSANEVKYQILHFSHAPPQDLRTALENLGLVDSRFPVIYDADSNTALVNGPPQYVKLVAQIAQQVEDNALQSIGTVVRVFQLRNGWAADHTMQVDGKDVTIPGVASILTGIYHPRQGGPDNGATRTASMAPGVERVAPSADVSGSTEGGRPSSLYPPLPPNMPAGDDASIGTAPGAGSALIARLAGRGGDNGVSSGSQDGGQTQGDGYSVTNGRSGLPIIQADPGTNSVLVRDTPARIDQYDPLIAKLDRKPKLIEIQASILEIDSDELNQLGVSWSARGDNFLVASRGAPGQTLPGGLQAVVGDSDHFIARINALAATAKAKIEATPTVATLDNVEAIMNNKTKFYVRVSGFASADLYAVSTGVSLRVLPMVVDDGDLTRIKLVVNVQDGQLTGQQVDNIPVVTNSEINTQAFVHPGQSLLIGGYSADSDANGVTGVPGLSRIPLLGALFRSSSNSKSHMQRLFLVSPKVLDL